MNSMYLEDILLRISVTILVITRKLNSDLAVASASASEARAPLAAVVEFDVEMWHFRRSVLVGGGHQEPVRASRALV